MKLIMRLILILSLCVGLFGASVLAQDATATPEPTTEAETDTETDTDTESTDDTDTTDTETSTIDIIDADFEGPASFVRFLHFVPGDMTADVYIDGELSDTQGLAFTNSGNWIVVPAGSHNISVTGAGDAVENAVWTGDIDFPENEPVILAVVANGADETPTVLVIRDDYGEVLPGVGTINFVNAMTDDTAVNLLVDDVVYITGAAAPEGDVLDVSNSIPIDAGTYTFSLSYTETDELVTDSAIELPVRDEDNYLFVATGTQDDPQLLVFETQQAQVNLMRGEVEAPGTIIDVLRARGHEDVVTAIENAGLTETLSGEGPFTLFLPADYLMDELGQQEDIATVLQNHIVEGDFRSSDILNSAEGSTMTTLAGNTLPFGVNGDNLTINDIQILDVNWVATNGVIHLIDGILAPTAETDE
jgi:uncharacterized surface protein with fasciclin (FAS1) repeats